MDIRQLTTASKVKDKSLGFIKNFVLNSFIKIQQVVLILSFVTGIFISINSYGQNVSSITPTSLHHDDDNINSLVMPDSGGKDSGFGNTAEYILNKPDDNWKGDTIKTPLANSIHPDGFMLVNYKLVMIKKGVITRMEKDVRLNNGVKVLRAGYVVKPNGQIILINQGEYLNMAGKILTINKLDVFNE